MCAVVLITLTTANAQFFVTGSLGADFSAGKYKSSGGTSTDQPSYFYLNIVPSAGYYLSDRFAVGLSAGFDRSCKNNKGSDKNKEITNAWSVTPFVRYHVLEVNNLALIVEGGLNIGGTKDKEKKGSTTIEGDPAFFYGFGAYPVLSYSFTDKLSIEASCDFLGNDAKNGCFFKFQIMFIFRQNR